MRISRRNLLLASTAVGTLRPAWEWDNPVRGRRFTGEALREVAFPLGGIGTGTISLGGYGNLRDWEIFNRPNKGGHMPYTFAALRLAGASLKQPIARVLEREPLPPYSQSLGLERGAGLPRFRETVFTGAYPFANVSFEDANWPVEVSLEAFNPFVPLEVETSSLPVAILAYTVRSRANSPLDGTLAFSTMNPIGYDRALKPAHRRAARFGGNRNEFRKDSRAVGVFMSSDKYGQQSFRHGTVALATDAQDVSYRLAWEHGALWDDLPAWWRDFVSQGRLPDDKPSKSEEGFSEYASLAAHFRLQPGASQRIVFAISWRFPNIEDYWTGLKPYFISQKVSPTRLIRNDYGTKWPSAWEPAVHALQNYDDLRGRSMRYRDLLHGSTLPPEIVDAVSTQVSTLRTNTVMVEEGGRVLAWEGCADDQGSCPMNCTHVYNYAQSMPFLFPTLERSMREIDLVANLREDGYQSFRTATPVQHGAYTKHPAADGQMGTILKLYRDWQISGDDAWLKRLWPAAQKALEFAWKSWDKDRDGIMEGEQHNTYDVRFIGPNPMMGSLYLAALVAASRMARHLGDPAAAERYETLYRNGSRALDKLLWNGSYYESKTDPREKYQFGTGCLSDQLLGQWFADLVGLGDLLPRERIDSALKSVVRNNFKRDFYDFPSGQRVYAIGDEQGLVNCTWPKGGRPAVPFGYTDEVWTGVEYEIAAELAYRGMTAESLKLVKAVRNRHNGARRNPWDELEAGHHYARGMSSWSLLTAWSGFAWSGPEKSMRFRPATAGDRFNCLFVTGQAWGGYDQRHAGGALTVNICVEGGTLNVTTLRVPTAGACRLRDSQHQATCREENGLAVIEFQQSVRINKGGVLTLAIS